MTTNPASFCSGQCSMSQYYHGTLRREFVANLLREEGDFLIRKSSDGESFVLSVMVENGIIRHFQPNVKHGKFNFGGEKFDSFDDLIQYHWKSGTTVTHGEVSAKLKTPVAHKKTVYKIEDVEMGKKLGEGNFGDVFKVRIISEDKWVAMKTLRENVNRDTRESFAKEMDMMATMRHENVVQCIGTVDDTSSVVKILLELINQGSLDKLLRKGKLTERGKARIVRDVARGLRYLHEFRIMHRDLAARNILVHRNDDNSITAKISDFGLSRRDENGRGYELKRSQKLPLKWLAPECFARRCWTLASDVWSFGVLMWEVFTNGGDPYGDMNFGTTQDMAKFILKGGHPSDVSGVNKQLHEVMTSCWTADPLKRPTMEQIAAKIEEIYPNVQNPDGNASRASKSSTVSAKQKK